MTVPVPYESIYLGSQKMTKVPLDFNTLVITCGNYEKHISDPLYNVLRKAIAGDDYFVYFPDIPMMCKQEEISESEAADIASVIVAFADSKKGVFLFAGFGEGFPRFAIPNCLKIIKYLKKHKCHYKYYYGSAAEESDYTMNSFMELIGNNRDLNLCIFNQWESSCKGVYLDSVKIKRKPPQECEKTFVCFNTGRWHRILFVAYLSHIGVLDKGWVSWNHVADFFTDDHVKVLKDGNNGLREIEQKMPLLFNTAIKQFGEVLPLSNTLTHDSLAPIHDVLWLNKIHPNDQKYFESSHFFVVTETVFGAQKFDDLADQVSEPCHFLTEKTYRNLMYGLPIMLLARPGSLAQLRKKGYKTFHPYINEHYDTIVDDQARMMAVAAEIKRLSNQTPEKWEEWHKHVDPICKHNRYHGFKCQHQIKKLTNF